MMDKSTADKELAKLMLIVEGEQTHDVHGSPIVPPNHYQLKHAEKQKQIALERIYAAIAASGIPWEDVVEYVESDPPTQGDRVQRHRYRAAKIRINQENAKRGLERAKELREAKKNGKQT